MPTWLWTCRHTFEPTLCEELARSGVTARPVLPGLVRADGLGPATPDELEEVFGVRELPATEVTTDVLSYLGHPEAMAVGLHGGGGVMRAADLVTFYQELLHNRLGLWDDAVLTDAKTNVRSMLPDVWTGIPASRTI